MRQPTWRVWHRTERRTFHYFASTLVTAAEVMQALSEYDELFGRETEGQGLEVLEAEGWTEWRGDDGRAIHEVIEAGDHLGR
jgi:hypothetical protein